jgi:hypothetical protein
MRNLLDESSVAQSLDGDRLMGSLHVPATDSKSGAAHAQQEPLAQDSDLNAAKHHEAVCTAFFVIPIWR